MTNDLYEELANVLDLTKCDGLKLEKCELDVAKLDRLLRGCRKKIIKVCQCNTIECRLSIYSTNVKYLRRRNISLY